MRLPNIEGVGMRKLASIRLIDNVIAHPNADRLDIVTIGGWQCIAKKGEFVTGNFCVYFEIDAFLPELPMYEFLGRAKIHQDRLGHRIKTIKLRGQLSQGLALPLKNFTGKLKNPKDGDDFTEVLGVIKYDLEIKINSGGVAAPSSSFPGYIRKTDQNRIQNLNQYFEQHKDLEFEETLKLDGSSLTMYKVKTDLPYWKKLVNKVYPMFDSVLFGVCSRNVNLKPVKTNQFWNMARILNIEESLPVGFAIQGELISPSIQKNHEKVKEAQFYVFDVFDIEKQVYLNPEQRALFLEILPNVNSVPVVNSSIKIFQECSNVAELLERVEGESINPGTVSEGRVYKCTTNSEITFKCVSNKYLLKEK